MNAKIHNHWLFAGLCLLTMTPAMVLAGTPASSTPPARPAVPITAAQRGHIQALAATALVRVDNAQQALQQHDIAAARQDLAEVRLLFDLIRVSHPAGQVKQLLRHMRNVLSHQDKEQALPDLLPVYSALDAMGDSSAVEQAHKHLDAAKRALEKPDIVAARQALDNTGKALSIAVIDFPLGAAAEDLAILTTQLRKKRALDSTKLLSLENNLLTIINGLSHPILTS